MQCVCCGSTKFKIQDILWKELINSWRLSADEVRYINKQQGLRCQKCGINFRAMALASALMGAYNYPGLFHDFVNLPEINRLSVLEINRADLLTQFFNKLPAHQLVEFPGIDMMDMKQIPDNQYDIVIHSDTLEHVRYPVRGLSECRRILRSGGICAFTIPLILDRFTVSREGLAPSYHGSPKNPGDNRVFTEFGADSWKMVLLAGFRDCRLSALEIPASIAFVAKK